MQNGEQQVAAKAAQVSKKIDTSAGSLDEGQLIDSKKLDAISGALFSVLGSGRMCAL